MNDIPFKTVNCLKSNILNELRDCDGLLWHWHHEDLRHNLIAKQILTIAEKYRGIFVFPDFNTAWHFDDKIAQTLIFDSMNVPIPNYWLFFDEEEAIRWIKDAEFPVVFKLRRGAGSANVKMINNSSDAKKIISIMFGKGISPIKVPIGEVIKKRKLSKVRAFGFKKAWKYFRSARAFPNERGYVYFQEFIPNCTCDHRIIVIGGNKAYGFLRYTRKNDFRASGSGDFLIDHTQIKDEVLEMAFQIANKLRLQCAAFDFLLSPRGFLLIEMSYGFIPAGGTYNSEWHGYWNEDLVWHEKKVDPVFLIIENLIEQINKKNQ